MDHIGRGSRAEAGHDGCIVLTLGANECRGSAARRRKRMATVEKDEGRKSHAEARPDVVKLKKRLARKKPKGGETESPGCCSGNGGAGILNEHGRPFNPKRVSVLLASWWRTFLP